MLGMTTLPVYHFQQGRLNQKEMQMGPCHMFSIAVFNKLYLFIYQFREYNYFHKITLLVYFRQVFYKKALT